MAFFGNTRKLLFCLRKSDSCIYELSNTRLTQAAVERKFEIIGEALNRLQMARPELADRIPRYRRVIDFRNLLIHGYASVMLERVWDYAANHLPVRRQVVQALIFELGSPEE